MKSGRSLAWVVGLGFCSVAGAAPQYIIAISVDGMGSNYANPLLVANQLPAIQKMLTEGAGTMNARTDAGVAITLPAHTGMVTGRPMNNYASPAIDGHNWTSNNDPAVNQTLHSNKGSYVQSVFDVMHDNGGSTAMWSGKSKFSLFDTSYNSIYGAPDVTGADNGKDKLDYVYINNGVSAASLTTTFLSTMASAPKTFSFVHFQDPDAAGHASGWGSTSYNNALKAVDTQIGNILAAIDASGALNGNTVVMLTADHGGHGTIHGTLTDIRDTQIPFLVWGAGVVAGDLYAMNGQALTDPLATIPGYTGGQPIRNGNIANLALDLLGLGPVPNSYIGYEQNIVVPEPTSLALLGLLSGLGMRRRRLAA